MGRWRTETETWLESERHENNDAAEAALTQLFAALPTVEPSRDFVHRTVDAAWAVRTRRRWMMAAAAAAALIAVAAGVTALFVMSGDVGARMLAAAATLAANSAVSLLTSATTLVEWWTAMARTGGAVGRVLVMPQGLAALAAIEIVGAISLYMLHRLLKADVTFRNSGPLCL